MEESVYHMCDIRGRNYFHTYIKKHRVINRSKACCSTYGGSQKSKRRRKNRRFSPQLSIDRPSLVVDVALPPMRILPIRLNLLYLFVTKRDKIIAFG